MSIPASDKAAIRQTIRALKKAGYGLLWVDDSEDRIRVRNESEAIDAITAVDMARLHVRAEGHDSDNSLEWVFFVLGNEPEEVICDHTVNLTPIIDPLMESWTD